MYSKIKKLMINFEIILYTYLSVFINGYLKNVHVPHPQNKKIYIFFLFIIHAYWIHIYYHKYIFYPFENLIIYNMLIFTNNIKYKSYLYNPLVYLQYLCYLD